MKSPSSASILEAAGRLFAERGYRAVTVRDIAASAGVSPALVMKLFISKEKLFAAVRPDETVLAELTVPRAELGSALVFRVLMRRERGVPEPWAMIPFTIQDAPDPEAARVEARTRYLQNIAALIGDTTPDGRFASTVIALMTGFGETVRTLGLFEGWDFDELVAHYGSIVQSQIDACENVGDA
ncbi:TetR family transcriptional regulator [Pseudarthrobacter sulfonivorans]|uniref:TetR family transcriptional regulator n=1 Tax=Pseudarthrobacter sulfonivorans TaxID=121292 RepID=A0A0U3P3N7_9MICC|nr:TetR/AcrR family transcriptional regulator [Pseudarthrobacter sulfonivorans]ALV39952.1 TetR family transcriptional regulator [Pseudarthrobacter sulfonivorans]